MSTFVTLLHNDLSSKLVLPPTASPASTPASTPTSKNALRSYFLDLQPPETAADAIECIDTLRSLEASGAFAQAAESEEEALRTAIVAKLLVGLYLQTLETYLNEASDAEAELEWWKDVERSRLGSAYYLLQTLPSRIVNIVDTIVRVVRSRHIPLRLSVFTPASLRELFPSRNILRPHTLTVALFPHLHHEPYPVSLFSNSHAAGPPAFSKHPPTSQLIRGAYSRVSQACYSTLTLPVELARHECRFKRQKLEDIRDSRAAVLGSLVHLRDNLDSVLAMKSTEERLDGIQQFVDQFQRVLREEHEAVTSDTMGPLEFSFVLTDTVLPQHVSSHNAHIAQLGLRRPSRLTLIWPKLAFLPPLALLAARSLYNSRDSLHQMAVDAVATLKGFWEDWLLGPLKEVVKTVRAGGDEGVIITKESVKADLESLERMALSLAKEKLNYTPEQMDALSLQIRHGDLTPVMQIYEDDIKNPLKSAVGGTLLRTLLVQVQKAKVDIDQALSGIDKLLKSQELTFAFVGVAPALTIVYIASGYLARLWTGSRGRGRYGGSNRRARVWAVMRRIERLLIATSETKAAGSSAGIDPRTSGLLLLSTTHLRAYAERSLPSHSRIRDGFLEDVDDLENPALGRGEKLRVVDRMWKSWGRVLGWYEIAERR